MTPERVRYEPPDPVLAAHLAELRAQLGDYVAEETGRRALRAAHAAPGNLRAQLRAIWAAMDEGERLVAAREIIRL